MQGLGVRGRGLGVRVRAMTRSGLYASGEGGNMSGGHLVCPGGWGG